MSGSTYDLIGRIINPPVPVPSQTRSTTSRAQPEPLEVLIGRIISPGRSVRGG